MSLETRQSLRLQACHITFLNVNYYIEEKDDSGFLKEFFSRKNIIEQKSSIWQHFLFLPYNPYPTFGMGIQTCVQCTGTREDFKHLYLLERWSCRQLERVNGRLT